MVLPATPLWLPGGVVRIVRVMDNTMVVRTIGTTLTAMTILNSVLAIVTLLTRARVSTTVPSLVLVRIAIRGLSIYRILRWSRLAKLLASLRNSHMPNRGFFLHGYILRWIGIYTMEDRGCWGPTLFRSWW